MKKFTLTLMVASLVVLPGCSAFKQLTGQTDNTVLSGTREDILPPDQQTARDPQVTGQAKKPCNPKLLKCPPEQMAQDLPAEDDLAPMDPNAEDLPPQ